MVQLYPAIDMKDGKCVRLFQGDYDQQTVYGESPFDMAKNFQEQGADWIHLVDLDGAKDGTKPHAPQVIRIKKELGMSVQIGGGIRSIEDVAYYLNEGIDRVIIGSLAVKAPQLVEEMLTTYGGDRIVLGLDAKDGYVATHGWLETSTLTAIEVGKRFAEVGAKHIIFTDIAMDGTLQGPNLQATKELAEATGLNVIVSGGISSLEDLKQVKEAAKTSSINGVIVGKAIYSGRFSVKQAKEALK
ncbi:1-(5-phosphoribosyl)-5-[(5-phosphoribosylamino)methylideneamino]imidazole-4-carboxamide isomerase [Chryseomicrobium palamuruense]|uniref:1-(5-phosphoribosyl)-5-[(5-phosphoribosylamino)methylideneamino] imidazole-4-carboxamide isomerase n=1 Tax=Chryseomicrobium palamuruense TaxID=682973 RepID=A0ABV8UXI8_9BACL